MNDRSEHPEVRPSTVRLPAEAPAGVATMLDFVTVQFPRVAPAEWRARFAAGEVWSAEGAVTADAPFEPLLEIHYRRAVACEPPVRTDLRVVWHDRDLLVVDKPPFLPVTPGGQWVRHTLLHLLGDHDLAPLHRLDRLTSGLVVLSRRPATRSHVARLFQPGGPVVKTYTAICEHAGLGEPPARGELADHLARSRDAYWRQAVVAGAPPNARTSIELLASSGRLLLYRVVPATGRKHQLRVQLAHAGLPIAGDPLYGLERRHDPDDLSRRLWLDAHQLQVTGFPSPDGATLDVTWRSSRRPDALLAAAVKEGKRVRA